MDLNLPNSPLDGVPIHHGLVPGPVLLPQQLRPLEEEHGVVNGPQIPQSP